MGSHYWLNYFTPEIDRIICANKNILKNFQSLGYPPEQLSLVPLGVDAGRFENLPARSLVKKEYGLNHKEHVVLFLGPLENHKGYKVFVEAAIKVLAKNADFLFVLATYDSPDIDLRPYEERKQEITHLIEDFPDNFKIMEGVLNAPELMACADFVAIPQTRIDGATAHPVTLLEAMAAKRVVIASDHRAISELITHGETGYLFGNNNSEDLANILLKVVDNMSLNQQIELNSYNLIKSKYEIETIASSIGILYAE